MSLFKNGLISIVTPAQFESLVLQACDKFGLPADLPEIEHFIAEAPSYIASGHYQPRWIDQVLNPSAIVQVDPDGSYMIPMLDTNILSPLTIARHFYPDLTARLTHLLADSLGLHLWSRGILLMSIKAGAIDPWQRDSNGKLAYVDACGMINELTGHSPRWERHFGHTSIIAAERSGEQWNLEFQFPGGFMRAITS